MSLLTDIIGHRLPLQWFSIAISQSRLSGSFLFVGSPGVGKATVAKLIAKSLLCPHSGSTPLEPCGQCQSCVQVEADSHPDLVQVRKPADRAYIPLELLIGPPESRLQEGFCRDVRLRPFQASHKVAILHDADYLNEEGANCLLKTLEEPPPDTVLFLIATNEQRQLPTIRSRCRIVRFLSPTGPDAQRLMARHGVECEIQAAEDAIELCGGDCQAAAAILGGPAAELRTRLAQMLGRCPIPVVELSRAISEYVDEGSKDAPQRRERLRDALAIAAACFRQELRLLAGQQGAVDRSVYRIDKTIDAIGSVQRNANQATLIESWSADVARGTPI